MFGGGSRASSRSSSDSAASARPARSRITARKAWVAGYAGSASVAAISESMPALSPDEEQEPALVGQRLDVGGVVGQHVVVDGDGAGVVALGRLLERLGEGGARRFPDVAGEGVTRPAPSRRLGHENARQHGERGDARHGDQTAGAPTAAAGWRASGPGGPRWRGWPGPPGPCSRPSASRSRRRRRRRPRAPARDRRASGGGSRARRRAPRARRDRFAHGWGRRSARCGRETPRRRHRRRPPRAVGHGPVGGRHAVVLSRSSPDPGAARASATRARSASEACPAASPRQRRKA